MHANADELKTWFNHVQKLRCPFYAKFNPYYHAYHVRASELILLAALTANDAQLVTAKFYKFLQGVDLSATPPPQRPAAIIKFKSTTLYATPGQPATEIPQFPPLKLADMATFDIFKSEPILSLYATVELSLRQGYREVCSILGHPVKLRSTKTFDGDAVTRQISNVDGNQLPTQLKLSATQPRRDYFKVKADLGYGTAECVMALIPAATLARAFESATPGAAAAPSAR
jgi:hypothetical protein